MVTTTLPIEIILFSSSVIFLSVSPIRSSSGTPNATMLQNGNIHDVYDPLIERAKIQHHFLICFDLDISKYSCLVMRLYYQC